MSDSYQAIYDAVRSRIGGCDVGSTVRDVLREQFDISHARAAIQQEACIAIAEYARPSAVYRPALSIDGDQWCALYGENIQDGVAGFGESPAAAMTAFDKAWLTRLGGGE